MIARIKKTVQFAGGVYFGENFYMAHYNVELCMNILTDDPEEQFIGMERINFFFDECISDVVFIEDTHKTIINGLLKLNFKVCTLPVEPYDQAIAYVIMNKINAITENRYLLTDLTLTSNLNQDIQYMIDYKDEPDLFSEKNKWWHENNLCISDVNSNLKSEKVVKLSKTTSNWNDLNLNWKKITNQDSAVEIVFLPDSGNTQIH